MYKGQCLKKCISLFLIIILSGCSGLDIGKQEVVTIQEDHIEAFTDLLKQGWQINVVDGRVVLIKYKNDHLLVNDMFNSLLGE